MLYSGGFTCTQQKHWGKCNSEWMVQKSFCKKSCNRCGVSAAEDTDSTVVPFQNNFFDDPTVFEDVTIKPTDKFPEGMEGILQHNMYFRLLTRLHLRVEQ